MTPAILAVVLALAPAGAPAAPAADVCAPLDAAGAPDPASAAAYRAVGDAELARGQRDTAAAAYRAAAAHDPADSASRATLARLCAEPAGPDPFAAGLARMEANDPAGALRAFRAAHGAAAPTPAVALLEGICAYDLGDDAEAEGLLRAAEAAPEHRDQARLYLGLLRLRAGDGREAAALFDAAASGPALSSIAGDLGRLARRDGPLVVSLLAESGWDSNVTLAPPAATVVAPEGDAAAGVTAAALWRPLGSSGPYVRGSAGTSRQLSLGAYDFSALDAAVGWQHRVRALTLGAEYDLGSRTLGGNAYLTAHRLLASASLAHRGALFSATYAARFESYASGYRPYSGVVHRAELRLAVPFGDRVRAALAYGGGRDLARQADLSFVEHGPRAELRVALGGRARLGLDGGVSFRTYDAPDSVLGVLRSDRLLDATALAELDVTDRLTARVALQGRRAWSSIAALEYEKLVPSIGLLFVTGL